MTDSLVTLGAGGTMYAGPDATKLFAAMSVRSGINLYLKTGLKPSRAYTPTNMSAFVSNITGKTYKRGKGGLAQAAADLGLWIEAMKCAMPVEDERR